MKKLIKKTIATFILLAVLSVSALADRETLPPPPPPPMCGDMQCPAPLIGDDSTSGTKDEKDQDLEDLSSFIIKMLEKVGFFF